MSAVYNFYFDEANGCQRAIITSGLWSERPTTGLTAGQRYFATDRSIEYAYNATLSKWLSTQLFTATLSFSGGGTPINFADTEAAFLACTRPHTTYDLYAEKVDISWYSRTLTSTDYFDATLGYVNNPAGGTTTITSISIYQVGRVGYEVYADQIPLNQVVLASNGVNTIKNFTLTTSTVGAPVSGGIYGVELHYRLIG